MCGTCANKFVLLIKNECWVLCTSRSLWISGSLIVNRAPDFDQKDFDQNDHFNLLLAFGNHRNGKNMVMFLPFRWVPNLESWLKWSFWSKSISRKNLKIGCPIHYRAPRIGSSILGRCAVYLCNLGMIGITTHTGEELGPKRGNIQTKYKHIHAAMVRFFTKLVLLRSTNALFSTATTC